MNYVSKRKMSAIFKNEPNFKLYITTAKMNDRITGCSGFVYNVCSNKYIYINTEDFVYGGGGRVLVRKAKNLKDYRGGVNHFIRPADILETIKQMTDFDYREINYD